MNKISVKKDKDDVITLILFLGLQNILFDGAAWHSKAL